MPGRFTILVTGLPALAAPAPAQEGGAAPDGPAARRLREAIRAILP